jgi:two-component system CheB/CheR fusion protein
MKPTGYLLLGASETTGGFAEMFGLADKRHKIYSKKSDGLRPNVNFGARAEERIEFPPQTPAIMPAGPSIPEIQKQADRLVLTHFSPAGVVINRHMEVLQFRGRTGHYLEHAHGEASLNLLKMAREGLTIDLRTVISKCIKQNTRVRHDHIRVKTNSHYTTVNLEVTPFVVPPSSERFYFVAFHDVPETALVRRKPAGKEHGRRDSKEIDRLREELAATRESLQAIIEEQEATNEELRSANEEIMSSNEELQSTNEELETAKEELQSTNEELITLNDELESRNSALENVNNDLHNLNASVNIPIVMVGTDLRIRCFTAVAEKLLNLIPADVGRPFSDIKIKVDLPNLDKATLEVMDTLQTKEIEGRDSSGRWWSVRIRPYRTTDSKIDGAVIAFVNIDQQKSPDGEP